MSLTFGRKHGNGYHDSITCKIRILHSQGFRDLLDYDSNQLREHSGVIYEQKFIPSWIKRVCIKCPDKYPQRHMEKHSDIFKCPECGLVKVPKGVEYKGGKKEDG